MAKHNTHFEDCPTSGAIGSIYGTRSCNDLSEYHRPLALISIAQADVAHVGI